MLGARRIHLLGLVVSVVCCSTLPQIAVAQTTITEVCPFQITAGEWHSIIIIGQNLPPDLDCAIGGVQVRTTVVSPVGGIVDVPPLPVGDCQLVFTSNSGSTSAFISIVASVDPAHELACLLDFLSAAETSGLISNPGIVESIRAKLSAALRGVHAGEFKPAENALDAALNELYSSSADRFIPSAIRRALIPALYSIKDGVHHRVVLIGGQLQIINTAGQMQFDSTTSVGSTGDLTLDAGDNLHGAGTAILVGPCPPLKVMSITVTVTRNTGDTVLKLIDPKTGKPMTFPVTGRVAQKTLTVNVNPVTSDLPGDLQDGDIIKIATTVEDSCVPPHSVTSTITYVIK